MRRVLLVEDEPLVRAVVARLLEREGCDVVVAPGGVEALAYIDQARTDGTAYAGLVTDVRMPDVGGVQVARAFRSAFPAAKILFMSGYHEDGEVHAMLDAGLAHFLAKPFTAAGLMSTVRALCPEGSADAAAATA